MSISQNEVSLYSKTRRNCDTKWQGCEQHNLPFPLYKHHLMILRPHFIINEKGFEKYWDQKTKLILKSQVNRALWDYISCFWLDSYAHAVTAVLDVTEIYWLGNECSLPLRELLKPPCLFYIWVDDFIWTI